MTMWAKQSEHGNTVEVNVTHGPVSITVKEEPGHLRHFWGELGRVLDQAAEQQQQRAAAAGD